MGHGPGENHALEKFVQQRGLTDVIHEEGGKRNEEPQEDQLTYWQGNHGARLDRGYASRQELRWVVDVEVVAARVESDHRGLVLWRRDPNLKPITSPLAPLAFPIHGRDPARISEEIAVALSITLTAARKCQDPWDTVAAHIRDALREVKLRERRPAARAQKNWRRRMRQRIKTLKDVVEYEQARVARRLQLRRGRRLGATAGQGVLERMSQRAPHVVSTLRSGVTGVETGDGLANVMADAWEPLLQTTNQSDRGADLEAQMDDLFQIPATCRVSEHASKQLMVPTTTEEVQATVKATAQHKAAGDDRLNNGFFREWSDLLTPVLVTTYNRILEGGAVPRSFGAAVVVPLPKNGSSPDPHDYRPIALLQSVYKIFTKLMAARLQRCLGEIINEDQSGFVRGREMASNIHIMQAILEQEYDFIDDTPESSPAIVLLDFRKAYDTLKRDFLVNVLASKIFSEQRSVSGGGSELGYPAGVSARSAAIPHCSRNPEAHDCSEEWRGKNKTPGAQVRVRTGWSAFVDDSVVFVKRGEMLHLVVEALDAFAEVSGLHVQPRKSHLILLNPRCTLDEYAGIPVVAPGDTARYLGVWIGIGELGEYNWELRMETLRKRLGRASQWITSVQDRVTVLNAVGIPCLLFTAKFFTPNPQTLHDIGQLWRQYLWDGTVTTATTRAHKITPAILELPPTAMGLGLHDPGKAMVAQAGRDVLAWNTRPRDKAWAAFHVVLSAAMGRERDSVLHAYPGMLKVPTLTGKTDLKSLGWNMVVDSMRQRYALPESIAAQRKQMLQRITNAANGVRWLTTRQGIVTIPTDAREEWTALTTATYAAMAPEVRVFWSTFPWAGISWITGIDGAALQRTQFRSIHIAHLQELQLEYVGEYSFTFRRPTGGERPPLGGRLRQLGDWVWTMIVNTGLFLDDPTAAENTRVYAATRHLVFDRYEWRHQGDGILRGIAIDQKWALRASEEPAETIEARYRTWGNPLEFISATGPNNVLEDFRVLQNGTHGVVVLAGHPDFNHGPTLPPALAERHTAFDRRTLARALIAGKRTKEQHERVLSLIERRLERGEHDEKEVFEALQATHPTTYTQPLEGLTVYQQLFRYKLVLGAHNTRNGNGEPVPCLHDTCKDAVGSATLGHIIWRCPLAQGAWTAITNRWTWRSASAQYRTQAFFMLEPPAPARALRQLFAEEAIDDSTGRAVFRLIWRTLCTIVSHQLWLARNNGCFRAATITTESFSAILWATIQGQVSALAAAMSTDSDTGRQRLGRGMQLTLEHLARPAEIEMPNATEVRLYYDGGARGNPGVSGAGYVIIAREAEQRWEIVHGEAIYCGESNTNNVAEHRGVARGLEACVKQYGTRSVSVQVIGDSALVTRQLNGTHNVRLRTLQTLATRSAQALAGLFDYQILHVRRAGNKMAGRMRFGSSSDQVSVWVH